MLFVNSGFGQEFGTFDVTNTLYGVYPTIGAGYIFTDVRTTGGTFQGYINGTQKNTGTARSTNITQIGFNAPPGGYVYSVQEAFGYRVLQSSSDRAIYDTNAAAFFGISGVTQ